MTGAKAKTRGAMAPLGPSVATPLHTVMSIKQHSHNSGITAFLLKSEHDQHADASAGRAAKSRSAVRRSERSIVRQENSGGGDLKHILYENRATLNK